MSNELVKKDINQQHELSVIEQVVMQGDLSKLTPEQRVTYYHRVCESSGLNPYTRPFDYISLNGKLTLYAKKDATEQLRKINNISIFELEARIVDDLYIVIAKAKTPNGRIDQATGAVVIGHLKGDAKANALMKAETKAKRRVTLSIAGLGWTDESEIETIPNARSVDVDMQTGEIIENVKPLYNQIPQQLEFITKDQARELDNYLSECDPKFRASVLEFIKESSGIEDLSALQTRHYKGTLDKAIANREAFIAKQMQEVNNENN